MWQTIRILYSGGWKPRWGGGVKVTLGLNPRNHVTDRFTTKYVIHRSDDVLRPFYESHVKQLLELMPSCGHDRCRTRTDKVNLGPRINVECLQKYVRAFKDLDLVTYLLLSFAYVRITELWAP